MTKEDDFMRLKKYFVPTLMIGMVLALTGCGEQFPSLTEEEYDQTVEYAVGLLMKYSRNEQAKLTYVDFNSAKKKREADELKLADAEMVKAQSEEEQIQNEYDDSSQDMSGADSSAESGSSGSSSETVDVDAEKSAVDGSDESGAEISVDVVDDNSGEAGKDSKNGPAGGSAGVSDTGAITLSSDQTQEILDDIFLSYQGYSVSSTYPESSKSYVINADKGKKLLVLRFDLYNASNSAKEVNMLKLNLLFQILLNGKNIGYSSVTFLPNDLTSYIGTIDSRAHESLAILTQIDEKNASNVDTLGLIMTRKGKDQKINLR